MGRLTHRTAPACTYFVTTKTFGNRTLFLVTEVAEVVARRIVACRDQGAYLLHEFVVMPNHVHLLLTPSDRTTLEKAIQLIKGGSSHEIHQLRNHKIQIWQPGFHDWTIRDSEDYFAKREYIQMNPVRAGLVEYPADWPYGSAARQEHLDPLPVRFKPASGAEAPSARSALMSELKLRPPEGGG
jgi:REP-associated tyrosine transposase